MTRLNANPPYWTAPSLDGVGHGFFGRAGGVSTGIYASLNAGSGSKDDPEAVRENRSRIAAAMEGALIGAHQVHSPDAVFVDAPFEGERPQADALVTTTPGLVVSVLTADCAPVLLADAQAGVIAAAHAGWKGALSGVLEATITLMRAHGAAPERVRAAVGPCIAQASYEVSEDFRAGFLARDATFARFFAPGAPGKAQFDLPGFVAARLRAAGIEMIETLGVDTYGEAEFCFSHRRSVHRNEGDYGRACAAIRL